MTFRNMYSSRDFENVMWGREFYEVVSRATQEAVDFQIRKEAIRICKISNIYERRKNIHQCPEILRGYLEKDIERIWKCVVDNKII